MEKVQFNFQLADLLVEFVLLRVGLLADLVRMKLTSFRLKDQAHVQDLDEAGLITPEVEGALSPILRDRLAEVRTHY